ncbi:hypothetical protein PITC_024390 [Penicillium italicum]|uniref:Uncharacterized protein n=1 Tax=Penicillium italicum TaxID=40296 RepID=A0A0A2LCZ5_PENIT|nr:hypothetical protein PITC_024390 [Penicillium italicum]
MEFIHVEIFRWLLLLLSSSPFPIPFNSSPPPTTQSQSPPSRSEKPVHPRPGLFLVFSSVLEIKTNAMTESTRPEQVKRKNKWSR